MSACGSGVSVTLGNGTGYFLSPKTYPTPGAVAVAVGVLVPGAGPAIVAANASAGSVSVLLNNGDGTFAPAINYATDGQPSSVAIGDLTGDGIPDIVTANRGTADLTVLAGKGDGTFMPAQNYPDGQNAEHPNAQYVALGDFRHSGVLDAVIADGQDNVTQHVTASYLTNDGHGHLGSPVLFDVGNTYQNVGQVIVGDFNGDGNLDFAAVTEGCGFGGSDVVVFRGDGHGAFTGSGGIGESCVNGAVAVDLTGTGRDDIVTVNGDPNVSVRVHLSNADGTFQPAIAYPAAPSSGARSSSIAVGNLKLAGEQHADIVIGDSQGLGIFLDTSSGASSEAYIYGGAAAGSAGIAGASIEACPGPGQACTDGITGPGGGFGLRVAPGTYTVTALAPSLGTKTAGPVTAGVALLNLNFSSQTPPPGVISGSSGSLGAVPTVNWENTSTYTVSGCKGGYGYLLGEGTNTVTGQQEVRPLSLRETPAGSGTYVADIPPLAPIHGVATFSQDIVCPSHASVLPSGGPSAGGTGVVLAGSGFTGARSVTFGSAPATRFAVAQDDAITATAPAGTGTVSVTVTPASGPAITVGTYSYMDVSGLNIGSGPASGGTSVTITGQGLTNVQGVLFGLQPASSFSVVSPTQIQAVAPPGVGTVDVQVINGFATTPAVTAVNYSYTGGPPETANIVEGTGVGVQPQMTLAAQTSAACDHPSVAISFSSLCDYAHDTIAGWNGMGPFGVLVTTGVSAVVAVLAGVLLAPELIPVALGVATITSFLYSLSSALHWNLFIDPSGVVVDTNGNLVSGATVNLLGQGAPGGTFAPVPPASGTIVPATNPQTTDASGVFDWEALAGNYEVAASAPGCHAPSDASQPAVVTSPFAIPPPAVGIEVTLQCPAVTPPAPVVSGLFPTSGTSSGGTLVEISGADLAHASAVHFGNVASPQVSELSPQLLTAVAPPGASTVDVTVTTPSGTSALATVDKYSYSTPPSPTGSPTITSISAAFGPVTGGPIVTVSGTNLGGVSSVNFAGEPSLHVTDVSSTQVTATVPARLLPGRVDVTAENAQGTSAVTPSDHFTYLSLPPPASLGSNPYRPVIPYRILDTRPGSGEPGAGSTLGPAQSIDVQVTGTGSGAGSVPANATAVVLNLTATKPTQPTFLTVYPAGPTSRPLASNLNVTPGETRPNLVEVPVGQAGKVRVFNHAGNTDVLADVEGYVGPASSSAGLFNPLAPSRITDTRTGSGEPNAGNTLGAGGVLSVQVTGNGGVPSSGVSAVVLNVTATGPTQPGFFTVYPTGTGSPPLASNLNFTPGETVPNRVIVPVGPSGQISIFNHTGQTDAIVDVNGWFTDGTGPAANGAHFTGITPTRITDTRPGSGEPNAGRTLGSGIAGDPSASLAVQVGGEGGIPATATAVVANVTVTNIKVPSFLTVFPGGSARPTASDLNWVSNQTVPNLVVAKLGRDGTIELYNHAGTADVVVDVVGWYSQS